MPRSYQVDLFCEDAAHEEFGRALIQRIARELAVPVEVHLRSAEGGEGRAMEELDLYQAGCRRGQILSVPHLLVVMIDADRYGWTARREQVLGRIDRGVFAEVVAGCPDPCIEAWYLADLLAFEREFGVRPRPRHDWICDDYKRELVNAAMESQGFVIRRGVELAPDIVSTLDYYRAGQANRSFGDFVDSVRAAMRRVRLLQP